MDKKISLMWKWLKWSLTVVVILLFILEGIESFSEIYLSKHTSYLTTWASKVMRQPIRVDSASVSRVGIEPVLVLHNVRVLHDTDNTELVKVKKLEIGIDLVSSLAERKIVPSMIIVVGADVHLYKNKDGSVTLAKPITEQNAKIASSLHLVNLLEWFCTQEKINFSNIVVHWNDAYGDKATFTLKTLKFVAARDLMGDVFPESIETGKARFLSKVKFHVNWDAGALTFIPGSAGTGRVAEWLQTVFAEDNSVSGVLNLYHDFSATSLALDFLADAQIKCQRFKFNSKWPELQNLDAKVLYDGHRVTINANKAKILNRQIESLDATIDDVSNPNLVINGVIHADMRDGQKLIAESPLRTTVGESLRGMILAGPLNLRLNLNIPLHKDAKIKRPIQVLGNIALEQNSLNIPAWKVLVSKLQGDLRFTEKAVTGDGITASLFNDAMVLDINTKNPGQANHYTEVKLKEADLKLDEVGKYFALPLNKIHGIFSYTALIKLYPPRSIQDNSFDLNSDLKGVTFNLPGPLSKASDEARDFDLHFIFKRDHIKQVVVNYAKQLTVELVSQKLPFSSQSDIQSGILDKLFVMPRLNVRGSFSKLVWADWYKDFAHYVKSGVDKVEQKITHRGQPEPKSGLVVNKVNAKFGLLHVWGQELKDAHFMFVNRVNSHEFTLDIDSNLIQGRIVIPNSYPHRPVIADFKRLYLVPGGDKHMYELKPSQVPALNLACRDFRYKDKYIGSLKLRLVPNKTRVEIQDLSLYGRYFDFKADGFWKLFGNGELSAIHGQMRSKNWGRFLTDHGWGQNLIGGHGYLDFSLSWPGPLYGFKLAILRGKMHLDVKDGQIVNLGKTTEEKLGVGRFLSLFSLQSLPRRLILDFSDLTSKGFLFDVMRGNFSWGDGNIFVEDAYLDGPIAKVSIKGRIGMVKEDYDLKLLTFPHVTSSLPVIATLTGGPLAGVVTWVATNIFSYEVHKATNYIFTITGNWHHPEVRKVAIPAKR